MRMLSNLDSQPLKPVAIIEFNNNTDIAKEHAQMVESVVKEANNNLGLSIHDYVLANENMLASQVEKIADDNVGLIIIVEPHDFEGLSKIPSLYPDINFTVIGVEAPLYFANVRSMIFKDQQGTYLMGVLAALRSKTGMVGFISKDNNDTTRNLAYTFLQGAKHANPDMRVTEQLGDKVSQGTFLEPASKASQISESKADIIFVLDEDLLESQIRAAAPQKKMIITYNHDLTTAYPGVVLTTLLKHYDLAIYHTLRSYARGEWKPGSQSMGIGNSFLDYVLNTSNKALLPKETIEQLETTKDFISQSVVTINTLAK